MTKGTQTDARKGTMHGNVLGVMRGIMAYATQGDARNCIGRDAWQMVPKVMLGRRRCTETHFAKCVAYGTQGGSQNYIGLDAGQMVHKVMLGKGRCTETHWA